MRFVTVGIVAAALACSGSGLTAQDTKAQGVKAQNHSAAAPKVAAAPKGQHGAPAKNEDAATVPKPLLPDTFAGWVENGNPTVLADAGAADGANAGALKEYGFLNGLAAAYKRDGETLTLKALHFGDVSGSYGAYSFYRGNGWPKEDIGSGASSNHNRVLFWKGDTLVDATFSHVSPESASELRELAGQVPVLQGAKAVIPPILATLPKSNLDGQTTHYAMGPQAYAGAGGVLPPELIGFDKDAETATASYKLSSGPATLTLIGYPTPQMAQAQETRIRAYIQAGAKAQPAFPKPLTESDVASLEVRRTGPVVALVSGDAIPNESHRLLGSVHYQSEIISIPGGGESEVSKTSKLLLGIASLVIAGSVAALALGFGLGGGRALYRIARGKPASTMYEAEFTSLNLRE